MGRRPTPGKVSPRGTLFPGGAIYHGECFPRATRSCYGLRGGPRLVGEIHRGKQTMKRFLLASVLAVALTAIDGKSATADWCGYSSSFDCCPPGGPCICFPGYGCNPCMWPA